MRMTGNWIQFDSIDAVRIVCPLTVFEQRRDASLVLEAQPMLGQVHLRFSRIASSSLSLRGVHFYALSISYDDVPALTVSPLLDSKNQQNLEVYNLFSNASPPPPFPSTLLCAPPPVSYRPFFLLPLPALSGPTLLFPRPLPKLTTTNELTMPPSSKRGGRGGKAAKSTTSGRPLKIRKLKEVTFDEDARK